MGVDLRLLPFSYDRANDPSNVSFTVLEVERRRELWEPIEALPARQVGEQFSSFLGRHHAEACEGAGYGPTTETPYGSPLTYVRASDLVTLADHEAVRDNALNRAVWAYLKELPPWTRVALYWC